METKAFNDYITKVAVDLLTKKFTEADQTEDPNADITTPPTAQEVVQDPNAPAEEGTPQEGGEAPTQDGTEEDLVTPEGGEPAPEVAQINAQHLQSHGTNTLELNDGTGTEVQAEVSDAPAGSPEDIISFDSGNYKQLASSAQAFNKKINEVSRTFLPLVEKAFIELLGNSGAYHGVSFNSTPTIVGTDVKIDLEAVYKVGLWLGQDIPVDAVKQDQTYIYKTISVMPGITIRGCSINTEDGSVTISATI